MATATHKNNVYVVSASTDTIPAGTQIRAVKAVGGAASSSAQVIVDGTTVWDSGTLGSGGATNLEEVGIQARASDSAVTFTIAGSGTKLYVYTR